MLNVLMVALGGAIGAVARYGVTMGAAKLAGVGFPAGTLFVNVTGSFLIGLGLELIARRFGASEPLRLLLLTGLLGGYTTFSAFSLDALALYERGAWVPAVVYVLSSVLLSLAAVLAGLLLGRHFG